CDYPSPSLCPAMCPHSQGRTPMKAMDRYATLLRRAGIALAGLLLCSPVVLAQDPPAKVLVDDVIPQGNHQVPPQKIISLIKTRPGLEYKQETVDEDVRKLYET